MVDYNELVERNQSGVIDDLDFLLEQEGLAEIYLEEMQEKGITPDPESASQWLREYELNNLYNFRRQSFCNAGRSRNRAIYD